MTNKEFKNLVLGDTVYQKATGKVLKFWQVHTPANAKREPIVKMKSVFQGENIFIKMSKSAFLEQYVI